MLEKCVCQAQGCGTLPERMLQYNPTSSYKVTTEVRPYKLRRSDTDLSDATVCSLESDAPVDKVNVKEIDKMQMMRTFL